MHKVVILFKFFLFELHLIMNSAANNFITGLQIEKVFITPQ